MQEKLEKDIVLTFHCLQILGLQSQISKVFLDH